jgi:iron complex transport system substrate-binding protein
VTAVLLAVLAVPVPADRTVGPPYFRAPSADQQVGPAPTRIVSLVPAVTEMLFAIGAGDEVVGISSWDRYPEEALSRPRVGALVDPDVERILSLEPDLVVTYGTQGDLIAQLDRAQVPIFNYEHAGLADITVTIEQLGVRVGRGEQGRALARRITQDLEDIRRRVAGRPRPSTALIFGREAGTLRGIFASGGVGFMHDVLELAGGTNVFADITRQSLQVSTETLLVRAPEVVLEIRPPENLPLERVEAERQVWSMLPALPAVRSGRTYLLVEYVLLVPGPRVAEAARMMARTLHPEAFGAVGPPPSVRRTRPAQASESVPFGRPR